MSRLDRIAGWRPRLRRRGDAPPPGLVPADKLAAQTWRAMARGSANAGAPAVDRELLAKRDRLTERFALLQADLGGVFYEMATRDHVRMDVLTAKAAELQRVDADLAQVERELRGGPFAAVAPPAGSCSACGLPHAASARFCSGCGQALATAVARTNGAQGAAP